MKKLYQDMICILRLTYYDITCKCQGLAFDICVYNRKERWLNAHVFVACVLSRIYICIGYLETFQKLGKTKVLMWTCSN